MNKLSDLRAVVAKLYNDKHPGRADWADWLYDNHVLVVAGHARSLAEKYHANAELAEAAALLHDVADYKMERSNPDHEAASLETARSVMKETGYSEDEIALVVDDAIRLHSCHGTDRPASAEGKILATADGLAHFKTDFYVYATRMFAESKTLEETKAWVLAKIDRDLNAKVSFDDERELVRPDYELLKNLFSR